MTEFLEVAAGEEHLRSVKLRTQAIVLHEDTGGIERVDAAVNGGSKEETIAESSGEGTGISRTPLVNGHL